MVLAWEPSKKNAFRKSDAYFHVVCKGLREEYRLKVPENDDDGDMWSEVRKCHQTGESYVIKRFVMDTSHRFRVGS